MDNKNKVMLSNLADKFGLDLAAVVAVKNVETGGRNGFLKDGRPQILFEGHIMFRELKSKFGLKIANRYAVCKPNIVYQLWDRSKYKGGALEYTRLSAAKLIDKECALKSASWGMFQIMGFNYKSCKCSSIDDFVEKMCTPEGQIELFFYFLESKNLIKLLKNHDWSKFARLYNGPRYRINNYDTKLEREYNKYCNENK